MKKIIESLSQARERTTIEGVLLAVFVALVAVSTVTVDPFGIKQAVLEVLGKVS